MNWPNLLLKLSIVALLFLALYLSRDLDPRTVWADDEPTAFVQLVHALPNIFFGKVAWGDYDNDGDVDLALTGRTESGSRITEIYRNINGTLARVAVLEGMQFSTVSWADYDNDADLDILIGGFTTELKRLTQLYRNENGAFVPIATKLLHVDFPVFSWGDYDNDGDMDLALGGLSDKSINNEPVTQLYRNDDGNFTLVDIMLPSKIYGAAWVDYDSDGDLDLASAQLILRNDDDQFTEVTTAFADLLGSRILWYDYDHDGDPDLLATGQWRDESATRLYENSAGIFTDTGLRLPGIFNGDALTWADVDRDGDDDIFLAGGTDDKFIAALYLNIDSKFFEAAVTFPAIQSGTADWGDVDSDGDLDLLYSGELQELGNYRMGLYRNDVDRVPLSTVTPQPSPTPQPTATHEVVPFQAYLPYLVR